ncbi:TIGR03943 family putative permease subunit [Cohnella rhizosphaerae]|uniref:TIGR03943 family protein n=1 Tax=Cohnella rhizosphaerae TaxID=1457232 RepID=A0A9X4QXF0_9BACL|nr:TIGR03943 family protein [Cohnella rhizosphaerae]MDG0813417.1 TIGR03943 family protein [Cohnella rhizosphaerae]
MTKRTSRSLIARHLSRAAVLAGIGVYVARLSAIGSLSLYISPRMAVYTKLAAACLYLIAAALVYQALKAWDGDGAEGCGTACRHAPTGNWLRQLRAVALFALPLALFFLTPDTTIGSAMAAQKGMNLSGGAVPPAKPAASDPTAASAPPDADELDRLFPHDSLTKPYADYGKLLYAEPVIEIAAPRFLETLTTLSFFPDSFVGRRASIAGFVYRDDTIGDGQFVLGRFAVQCCAADAIPYGIVVESPDAAKYASDKWMTVTGILAKTTVGGSEVLLLKADAATGIEPADDPYVYPDMSFGA